MELKEALGVINAVDTGKATAPIYIQVGDKLVIEGIEWVVKVVGVDGNYVLYSPLRQQAKIRGDEWLMQQSWKAENFKLLRESDV